MGDDDMDIEIRNLQRRLLSFPHLDEHFKQTVIKRESQLKGNFIKKKINHLKAEQKYEPRWFELDYSPLLFMAYLYEIKGDLQKSQKLLEPIPKTDMLAEALRIHIHISNGDVSTAKQELEEFEEAHKTNQEMAALQNGPVLDSIQTQRDIMHSHLAFGFDFLGPKYYAKGINLLTKIPKLEEILKAENSDITLKSFVDKLLQQQEGSFAVSCNEDIEERPKWLIRGALLLANMLNKLLNKGATYSCEGSSKIDLKPDEIFCRVKNLVAWLCHDEIPAFVQARAWVVLADVAKKCETTAQDKYINLPEGLTRDQCFEVALKLGEDDSFTLERYGRHKRQMATGEKALILAADYLQKATEINPNRHVAFHQLGLLYRLLFLNDIGEKEIFDNAMRRGDNQKKKKKKKRKKTESKSNGDNQSVTYEDAANPPHSQQDALVSPSILQQNAVVSPSDSQQNAVVSPSDSQQIELSGPSSSQQNVLASASGSRQNVSSKSESKLSWMRLSIDIGFSLLQAWSDPNSFSSLKMPSFSSSSGSDTDSLHVSEQLADMNRRRKSSDTVCDSDYQQTKTTILPRKKTDHKSFPTPGRRPDYYDKLRARNPRVRTLSEKSKVMPKNLQKAKECLEKACEIECKLNCRLLTDLGRVLVSCNEVEEARRAFQTAYNAKNQSEEFHNNDLVYLFEQWGLLTEELSSQETIDTTKGFYRKAINFAVEGKLRSRLAYYKLKDIIKTQLESVNPQEQEKKQSLELEIGSLENLVNKLWHARSYLEKNVPRNDEIVDKNAMKILLKLSNVLYKQKEYENCYDYLMLLLTLFQGDPELLTGEEIGECVNMVLGMPQNVTDEDMSNLDISEDCPSDQDDTLYILSKLRNKLFDVLIPRPNRSLVLPSSGAYSDLHMDVDCPHLTIIGIPAENCEEPTLYEELVDAFDTQWNIEVGQVHEKSWNIPAGCPQLPAFMRLLHQSGAIVVIGKDLAKRGDLKYFVDNINTFKGEKLVVVENENELLECGALQHLPQVEATSCASDLANEICRKLISLSCKRYK